MDRGAWRATVQSQSPTRLKWLSTRLIQSFSWAVWNLFLKQVEFISVMFFMSIISVSNVSYCHWTSLNSYFQFCFFPCGLAGKESACDAGDLGSIPGLGRSAGEGKGYPLQYSGLENSMDCIVYGVAKSWTRLSDFHSQTYKICSFLVYVWMSYLLYIWYLFQLLSISADSQPCCSHICFEIFDSWVSLIWCSFIWINSYRHEIESTLSHIRFIPAFGIHHCFWNPPLNLLFSNNFVFKIK